MAPPVNSKFSDTNSRKHTNKLNKPKMTSSSALSSPLLLLFLSLVSFPRVLSATTYDSFLRCLSKTAATPTQKIAPILFAPNCPSFASVLKTYIRNARLDTSNTTKPSLIITPTDVSHVQAAVVCTKSIGGLNLKTRSGGHDYEGLSYASIDHSPFVLLDMFNLRAVSVDPIRKTARLQAGATLGELYYYISEKSKVLGFPAGLGHSVGAGGHITGGGYGAMLRKYGLSSDNVADAQIVDVNGKLLDRKAMGEDLFWAIRGGGGASFGVVVSFTVNLVAVPETVTVYRAEKRLEENMTDAVYKWQTVADKIDDDLFIRVLIQPVSSTVTKGATTVLATFMGLFLGDSKRLLSLVGKEFPEMGLAQKDCQEMNWVHSVLYLDNYDVKNTTTSKLLDRTHPQKGIICVKKKSDYLKKPIPREGLEALWKKIIELRTVGMVFNPYGGRMAEIPAAAIPFPHRAGNIAKLQYTASWDAEADQATTTSNIAQIRDLYNFMSPFVSSNPREAFLNYRDLDVGMNHHGSAMVAEGKVYGESYFKGNYERLVKVKTAVDPDNFFRNEQSIPPLK